MIPALPSDSPTGKLGVPLTPRVTWTVAVPVSENVPLPASVAVRPAAVT